MSVVCLTGSSASRRPFESTRCDAKMVLMSVDFPRPVWPTCFETASGDDEYARTRYRIYQHSTLYTLIELLTDENHVELETALEELFLNLGRDRVEANVGRGANFFSSRLRHDEGTMRDDLKDRCAGRAVVVGDGLGATKQSRFIPMAAFRLSAEATRAQNSIQIRQMRPFSSHIRIRQPCAASCPWLCIRQSTNSMQSRLKSSINLLSCRG